MASAAAASRNLAEPGPSREAPGPRRARAEERRGLGRRLCRAGLTAGARAAAGASSVMLGIAVTSGRAGSAAGSSSGSASAADNGDGGIIIRAARAASACRALPLVEGLCRVRGARALVARRRDLDAQRDGCGGRCGAWRATEGHAGARRDVEGGRAERGRGSTHAFWNGV